MADVSEMTISVGADTAGAIEAIDNLTAAIERLKVALDQLDQPFDGVVRLIVSGGTAECTIEPGYL